MGEVDKEAPSSAQEAEVLYPGFSTIAYGDRRTPEELRIGTPLFRNEGFVQVALHLYSFASLFREAGLTPTQINEIEFVFRPATIADRNFFGETIWGLSLLSSGYIEIFTTILAERMGACHTHIPLKRYSIARTLAHEAGHVIRARKGEVDQPTFAVPRSQHGEIVGETKAKGFAQEQLSRLVNKLVIKEDPLFPFRENTQPRVVGEVAGLETRVDLDHRIEVWTEDWPPLDLHDEVRAMFLQPKDISSIPIKEIERLLEKAKRLVRERWLGVAEFNYMVSRLRVACAERGTPVQVEALTGKEIRSGQVKFFRKRLPRDSRAGVWLEPR